MEITRFGKLYSLIESWQRCVTQDSLDYNIYFIEKAWTVFMLSYKIVL